MILVMISACFCHLLAEALEDTEDATPNFPLAPFLCAFGYLLTLSADQYATYISKKTHHHHNGTTLLKSDHTSSDAFQKLPEDTVAERGQFTLPHRILCCVSGDAVDRMPEQSFEVEGIEHEAHGTPRMSFLTALFLGMALSLHSVLEGLALGAQQSIHATKNVLIAIAAHKGLAAYALGASLVDSKADSFRYLLVAGGFSAASPFGIMVGYALSEVGSSVVAASLSALASGTFLYVAAMEIIPTELEASENILSKLIVMFIGFGAMSTLAIWA